MTRIFPMAAAMVAASVLAGNAAWADASKRMEMRIDTPALLTRTDAAGASRLTMRDGTAMALPGQPSLCASKCAKLVGKAMRAVETRPLAKLSACPASTPGLEEAKMDLA